VIRNQKRDRHDDNLLEVVGTTVSKIGVDGFGAFSYLVIGRWRS
jgi:hypothetical protein